MSTSYADLVDMLRRSLGALDRCLNSSDLKGALEEADDVLTDSRKIAGWLPDHCHEQAVLSACCAFYGMAHGDLDGCYVTFVDGYITDCPGYSGPVAIVVGSGGPELITVCLLRGGVWIVEASYPQAQPPHGLRGPL